MRREPGLSSVITSVWFRLTTLAILALGFYEAIFLTRGKAEGWSYYLTGSEVAFEVAVRLASAALGGLLLGTVATAGILLFLWYFKTQRQRIAEWTISLTVIVVLFLVSRVAWLALVKMLVEPSSHMDQIVRILLVPFYVAFAAALCIPRTRQHMYHSFDGLLSPKMTRRTALATLGGTAALVVTEYAFARKIRIVKAALPTQRPKSNFLLVTFDALSAEDMSLYGRELPTTPNIDAFAGKSTVFTSFFSSSTFTTPSLATVLSGMYPSESHVFQLQGQMRPEDAPKTLPHLMRKAGYSASAFVSSPFAYYFTKSFASEFDVLPDPAFEPGGLQRLWEATTPLHQDSGIGCRLQEYLDLARVWNYLNRTPSNLPERYGALTTFEHAQQIMARLPDGFFLWVHVMAPHNPYRPGEADQGRFVQETKLGPPEEEDSLSWKPRYSPEQQPLVDLWRLRYDEFVATTDRAFGAFMGGLESSGKLQDTTVIVSSDHGESFQGGVYQHESPHQTRPIIHIPLIIRTPGQKEGHTVRVTADQTSLAPTILEMAEQPKPEWMRGPSLMRWLNGGGEDADGYAFTQHLETNSVPKPIRHGSVGVVHAGLEVVVPCYFDAQTQKRKTSPLEPGAHLDNRPEHGIS
jgi:arylsulfatase A-like enzyme